MWSNGHRDLQEEQKPLIDSEDSSFQKKKPRAPKPRKAKEEDSYSDEDGMLIPLGSVTKPQRPPPVTLQCLEIDIQPGETLTSISLKYSIPIAELKRVNNFLTGNEIFALKRIKIPVKPSSLLTELLPSHSNTCGNGWHIKRADTPETGGTSSTVPSSPNSEADMGTLDEEAGLAPLHAKPSSPNKNTKKVKSFLKSVDEEVKRAKEKHAALVMSSSESGSSDNAQLSVTVGEPASRPNVSRCGLLCLSLVVIAVVIILLIAKHESFEIAELHHHFTSKAHQTTDHKVEKH